MLNHYWQPLTGSPLQTTRFVLKATSICYVWDFTAFGERSTSSSALYKVSNIWVETEIRSESTKGGVYKLVQCTQWVVVTSAQGRNNWYELTLLGCFGLGLMLMNTSNCSINCVLSPAKKYHTCKTLAGLPYFLGQHHLEFLSIWGLATTWR